MAWIKIWLANLPPETLLPRSTKRLSLLSPFSQDTWTQFFSRERAKLRKALTRLQEILKRSPSTILIDSESRSYPAGAIRSYKIIWDKWTLSTQISATLKNGEEVLFHFNRDQLYGLIPRKET